MKPRGRLAEESRSMKQFGNFSPKGLKVLVVDDDPLCLMVLERMLRQCDYNVTTCNRVSEAISMVMENKDRFDLVMSDVYMPREDGFKLLEIIGLNLDLPVIKAVPKKILEIMGVHGLTRENVASHLQKYRLYLKRLSGTIPEPCPVASFQAAEGGKSGGTMQIKPGGKSAVSSLASIKGLKLGIRASPDTGFESTHIDRGTLKSLEQYRAYEQKRAANRAQVLGGIGILPSKKSNLGGSPDTRSGLQRMSSVDLSLIWKAHRDQHADQSSGTEPSDDIASQSFRNVVKLEDAQSDPISVQHITNRHSGSRHSRAQSLSSVSIDFRPRLALPASQAPKPAKTVLKDISELESLESISWVAATSSEDRQVGTDANVDLFDELVEEYGICSLSSPTSSDIEAMSGPVMDTAPDSQVDEFLQQ